MEKSRLDLIRMVELVRSEAAKCRAQAKYCNRIAADCVEVAEALETAAAALEENNMKAEVLA